MGTDGSRQIDLIRNLSTLAVLASMLGAGGALAEDVPIAMSVQQQSEDKNWTLGFESEVRYFTWQGTRGDPTFLDIRGHGHEVYVPLALTATTVQGDVKFEGLVRGGYVFARQGTIGAEGSVSTWTDTVLSGTATYTGLPGVMPFVSVNINAPTGKSAILGMKFPPRMDPDYVDVATFGEGFNIGPSVGVNVPLGEFFLVSLSAGYTARGRFKRENFFAPPTPQDYTIINPGDVRTLNASLNYSEGPLTAQAAFSATFAGPVINDDRPQFRPGTQFSLSGAASYQWNGNWVTSVNSSWSHSEKNQLIDYTLNTLVWETLNSNSNVFKIGAEHNFAVGDWLSFGPLASILRRDQNSWSVTDIQFLPAKTRYSVGLKGRFSIDENYSINARVERIWSGEGNQILSQGLPFIFRQGWLTSVGGSVKF